jgi:hypothetical protein
MTKQRKKIAEDYKPEDSEDSEDDWEDDYEDDLDDDEEADREENEGETDEEMKKWRWKVVQLWRGFRKQHPCKWN